MTPPAAPERDGLAAEAAREIDDAMRVLRLLRRGVAQPELPAEVLREFLSKIPTLKAALGALCINSAPGGGAAS